MYFDDPNESDAIQAAKRYEPKVEVFLCTTEFWSLQRATNPFFRKGFVGGAFGVMGGQTGGGLTPENFEKGDVQSRQCVAVQHATALAADQGFDWLLHVDIDELWYSPCEGAQYDAPAAFMCCPREVEELGGGRAEV